MPRGGKRVGAGMKPGKHGTKGTKSLRLTPDVMQWLDTLGEQSKAVDEILRRQAAFKAWKKSVSEVPAK